MLAEELLDQLLLEKERTPALVELLRQRLADHEADPDAGVPWETLRARLLRV